MPNHIEKTTTYAPELVLNEQNEIQEIIGHPPSWILKWGILLILFAVFGIGYLSWLIRYPDVLLAPVIVTTEQPVIRVVAQQDGVIENLFFQDQASVLTNDLIAVLKSDANWKEIVALKEIATTLNSRPTASIQIPENWSVGTIQTSYTSLLQEVKALEYFLQQEHDAIKKTAAQQQIKEYELLNIGLSKQVDVFKEEKEIVANKYARHQELYATNTISLEALKETEVSYLQYKRRLSELENQHINNRITIEQLRTSITEIDQTRQERLQNYQLTIVEYCQKIKGEIASWEQLYLIKAPISGQLSMREIWSEQQFIAVGEAVFTIVPPEGTGKLIVRATMPAAGIGKVKKGMRVNILLDGYPPQEYGVLKGEVAQISLLPEQVQAQEHSYLLELMLNNELHTTYGKQISLHQEMPGVAEVITEDRRIFERIFEQLLHILKNN